LRGTGWKKPVSANDVAGSDRAGLAACLRRLVAHPTVEQHAQRGDEAERLVEHDVVSRLRNNAPPAHRSIAKRHQTRRGVGGQQVIAPYRVGWCVAVVAGSIVDRPVVGRFVVGEATFDGAGVSRERGSLERCCPYGGPMVRIRLPPGASPVRTRHHGAERARSDHQVWTTPEPELFSGRHGAKPLFVSIVGGAIVSTKRGTNWPWTAACCCRWGGHPKTGS
jgi:hypothetical protein